jgi:hypothetical protein
MTWLKYWCTFVAQSQARDGNMWKMLPPLSCAGGADKLLMPNAADDKIDKPS